MRRYKSYEVEDDKFYQIPKSLFGNPIYKGLLPEAKLVYAFLRDRKDLSKQNGWETEQNDIYLLFTREHIAELLEMSLPSITKCFKQLNEYELIQEKRQGLGKPNLIFVGHVELSKEIPQKQRNLMSGQKENLLQDTKNICTNDTDFSDTETNETDIGIFQEGKRLHLSNEGKNLFDYYKMYYRIVTKEEHKPLTEKTINKINKLVRELTIYDEKLEESFDITLDDLETMVSKYFNNKYDCDRNINHFLNEKILRNLYYQINFKFEDKIIS